MNERLFIQIFEIILAIISIGGIAFILAATWYDLRIIHYKKHLQIASTKMTGRRQPSITVLVYARNAVTSLEACLNSIHANQYKHFKVIVADNHSTDDTKKYLATYKRTHPNISLLTYHAKRTTDRSAILRQAYKKDTSSQLVIILDATDTIPPTLLQDCALRFVANDNLDVLRLRPLPTANVSITSSGLHFYMQSKNIVDKSFARSPFLTRGSDKSGIVMKSSIFKQASNPRKITVDYASALTYLQSLPNTHPFTIYSRSTSLHSWKRIVSLCIVVIGLAFIISIATYFFYTAATLQSNVLLTLSWTIVCLWLLAVIWSDDVYASGRKIELTSTVPFMYFIFYTQMIFVLLLMLWKILRRIPPPNLSLNKMHDTIQLELYSTRY